MTNDLEPPAGEDEEWGRIYRARGDEVEAYRPAFTGDVFDDVSVSRGGVIKSKSVMVIQHPCAMRTNGSELVDSLLVAEVRRHKLLTPEQWRGYGKLMPLPDLRPDVDSSKRHAAALFDELYFMTPTQATNRVACLSQIGVNLLLQRWVHHNSRVVVPTFDFQEATAGVYEEADLIEEWCEERAAAGVGALEATAECVKWLRTDNGDGAMRQRRLEDSQSRSAVRKEMRVALRGMASS